MTTFYIKYVPPRRGLDMVEYLQDYLTSINSAVTFSPCFYDNIATFGVLAGSGDDLSRVVRTIETRHGAVRLTANEFAGASVAAFQSYKGPEDINQPGYIAPANRPNWVAWMAEVGITVQEGDELNCAKYYKATLLKEIAKKKFCDDNDSLADLAKAVIAITVHYPDLTIQQKVLVDNQIAIIKQIYTPDIAVSGLTELVSNLTSNLIAYYNATTAVSSATTLKDINDVIYE